MTKKIFTLSNDNTNAFSESPGIALKTFNWVQENQTFVLGLVAIVVFNMCNTVYANSTGTNDSAFGNALDWLESVVDGKLGTLMALIGFVISIIGGFTGKWPVVVGGFVFALLIKFGPGVITGLVSSLVI